MYIQIDEPAKRCSQCESIGLTEYITRGNQYLIRCRKCGHEKIISEITWSSPAGNSIYEITPPPKIEDF